MMSESDIDLDPDNLQLLREILKHHLSDSTLVWVFGSRANHTARPFSDIDIVIDMQGQTLSASLLTELTSECEGSDLPMKVDIVDWNTIDETFKEIIKNTKKSLSLT